MQLISLQVEVHADSSSQTEVYHIGSLVINSLKRSYKKNLQSCFGIANIAYVRSRFR